MRLESFFSKDWVKMMVAVLGGVLVGAASFFPIIAPLAWFGLVPLFYIILHARSIKGVFVAGFFVGCAYATPVLTPLLSLEHWSWEDSPIFSIHSPALAWSMV